MYIYTYIHTYIHTYMHSFIHTYIYTLQTATLGCCLMLAVLSTQLKVFYCAIEIVVVGSFVVILVFSIGA